MYEKGKGELFSPFRYFTANFTAVHKLFNDQAV